MASLLVKQLASRVIKSGSMTAPYAMPLGGDGASAYSSANMMMIGEADEREMSATFRICEASEDDDGDIVRPDGCDLSRYKSNPCVLFHHDKDSPGIGLSEDKNKTLHLTIKPTEIVAKCFFHGLPFKGQNLSQEIFNLVCKGALRGASVGFLPIEAKKRGYDKDAGYEFVRWLLTEWSITPIPANSETLRMCLSRGYVKSLELKTRLEGFLPSSPEWANGATLLSGDKTVAKKLRIINIEADRDVFKSLKDASAILKAKGYDVSVPAELATAYIFEQNDGKAGAGQKTLGKGLVANLGYVTKAKEDDEDDKPDDETPMEESTVEKDDDGDADDVPAEVADEVPETPAEDAETEPETVDHSQKPGAKLLALYIGHNQGALDGLPGLMAALEDDSSLKKKFDKIMELTRKEDEAMRALFAEKYPGADLEAMMAPAAEEAAVEPESVEDDLAPDVDADPLDETVTKTDDDYDKEFVKTLKRIDRKLATKSLSA